MKLIKLTLCTLACLTVFSPAIASKRVAGSIALEGKTVKHATSPGSFNVGGISLPKVYEQRDVWNITCDYSIEETNNAAQPSLEEPAAISIKANLLNVFAPFYVSDYTANGIIAPKGKLSITGYRATISSLGQSGSITIQNYDSTADITVYNCQATYVF